MVMRNVRRRYAGLSFHCLALYILGRFFFLLFSFSCYYWTALV
jgi:hypothetical protein